MFFLRAVDDLSCTCSESVFYKWKKKHEETVPSPQLGKIEGRVVSRVREKRAFGYDVITRRAFESKVSTPTSVFHV